MKLLRLQLRQKLRLKRNNMILLVGLGNPGSEYALTRHNIGFMAADEISRRYNFDSFKEKFKGLLSSGTIAGEKVLLLKPQTYMNLSGESVLAVCTFYKIKPSDIIVFHDDMDLPVGKIRVKTGGGSGGHNGLKSIDSHIGSNYMRVRIGVSKPQTREEVINWVLSRFPVSEQAVLNTLMEKIAIELPLLLTKDDGRFMNKIKLIEKG